MKNNGNTWLVCISLDSSIELVIFNTVLCQNDWDLLGSIIDGWPYGGHKSGNWNKNQCHYINWKFLDI